MNKLNVFFRKIIYVVRKVIPAIIKEFNSKDGYIFRTNFDNEDEEFYRKTLDKLGTDYRISGYATDCNSRPIKGLKALYIRGNYNHENFFREYRKYTNKKHQALNKS